MPSYMKHSGRRTEYTLVKAFILAICLATFARASLSYLPLTGPTSMRVQAAHLAKSVTATPVLAELQMPIAKTSTALDNDCTNPPNAYIEFTNRAQFAPVTVGDNGWDGSLTGNANEVLSVTPVMLANYFQPYGFNTIVLATPPPFKVEFIPPLAEPDKSSHAEYIVK